MRRRRREGGETPAGEYARHRRAVLGMLGKRFPRLDENDRLAIYHDAWTRVLVKRRSGERIESLRAFLLATAGAEALNAVTRRRPPAPVGPDDPLITGLPDHGTAVEDQVVIRDQARIARNLLDSLDERQRDVLKLRWDLQLTGAEVRAALGLSERQYQRLTEEGAAAIAERVQQLENGSWSRRQRSLLAACLVRVTNDGKQQVGIASEHQREQAQRLLDSDPHVAALFAEVRRALRNATALLPMPALLTDGDALATPRLTEIALQARAHLTDLIQAAKQHATSLYLRTADPSLLTTPRPGAALATAAAGLALTGGAYTARQHLVAPTPTPQTIVTAQPRSNPTPTFPSSQPNPSKAVKHSTQPRLKPISSTHTPKRSSVQSHAPPRADLPQARRAAPDPASASPPPDPREFGFEN